jgi:hypothetical protein
MTPPNRTNFEITRALIIQEEPSIKSKTIPVSFINDCLETSPKDVWYSRVPRTQLRLMKAYEAFAVPEEKDVRSMEGRRKKTEKSILWLHAVPPLRMKSLTHLDGACGQS